MLLLEINFILSYLILSYIILSYLILWQGEKSKTIAQFTYG